MDIDTKSVVEQHLKNGTHSNDRHKDMLLTNIFYNISLVHIIPHNTSPKVITREALFILKQKEPR